MNDPHLGGPRPRLLVVAIGTATEIGKTWVGAATLSELRRRGLSVAARKPAQSFDPEDDEATDAEALAAASGEDPDQVCLPTRHYPVAYAPPMAAEALGLPGPTMADVLGELSWPAPSVDVGWVETVGGPRSPIALDGDAVDLVDALEPDLVVLVADAGLGTVNAVLLALAPFAGRRTTVVLNRYDPTVDLHRRNLDWLRTRQGLDVVVDIEALANRVEDPGDVPISR